MAITTADTLPPQVALAFQERLLSVPVPNLIHSVAADKRRQSAGNGNKVRLSRYELLPTALTPLGKSGINPPPVLPERIDIDVEMQYYGLA